MKFEAKSRKKIERVLNDIVKPRVVHLNFIRSSRIEDQFGGETIAEEFSALYVFLQYSVAVQRFELIKDIIDFIYFHCCKDNSLDGIVNRIYLFNNINNSIKLSGINQFRRQSCNFAKLEDEILAFEAGENMRIISQFIKNYGENALFIFITDKEGCRLSDDIAKRNRTASKQSLWVRILDEDLDIHKGLPELNRGSLE